MKRILLGLVLLVSGFTGYSQRIPPTYQSGPPTYHANDESPKKGFDLSKMYVGGSLGLGFGTGQFSIGANPEVGYSVTNWFDAGLMFNINYTSLNGNYYGGVDQKSFNYGVGAYGRVYPLPFLFLQVQPEENWVSYSFNGTGAPGNYTTNAFSFIGGVGYSQRVVGQSGYYIMLGMDLLRNPGSPYLDYYNTPLPIVRAGFTFYLGRH
ncbi:hypothetical protein ACI6Q2_21460 [Chitinophagaceae bacterium LWZ2-11]